MKVAIVVDSPKRDLDGALLVAYQLACRGVEAYLVPLYQQGYDLPWLQPDGVIVNYARENNRDLLNAYRALGICVMVMDTEGGVLSAAGLDAPLNWAREMRRSGLASSIDRYFFWGSRLHEAFRIESGMAPASLHVTGCPRFDFCADPWRSLLNRGARVDVLVNTNFSAINPGFTRSKDAEKAIFRQLGWQGGYVERLFADLDAVYPRYLDTLVGLVESLPTKTFRVRPHPFEDEAVYRNRFARMPNVTVDGSGNVLHAIANADCVVHLNCGTAVESLMLGTPALALEFLNSEVMRAHAPLPSQVSIAAGSFDELRSLITESAALRAQQAPRRAQLIEELLLPWFHRLDGCAAARVAMSAIEALAGRPTVRRSALASLSGSRPLSTGRLLSGIASNLFGSRRASRLARLRLPRRAGKAVHLEEVRAGIARLRTLDRPDFAFVVTHARHPLSRISMATIRVAAEK